MAWQSIPGSNNALEYDDSAGRADTAENSPGTISAGIRSFSFANSDIIHRTYIQSRRAGTTAPFGEISLNFYSKISTDPSAGRFVAAFTEAFV